MGMRGLALSVLAGGLIVGAGVGLASLDLDELLPNVDGLRQSEQGDRPPASGPRKLAMVDPSDPLLTELTDQLGGSETPSSRRPSFDVARISPNGVSVFAGQSKPFELINVMVGGQIVGSTKADGDGNWALVTEQKIADPSGELGLKAGVIAKPAKSVEKENPKAAPVAVGRERAPSVADVNKRLLASLSGLVEKARARNQAKANAPPGTGATVPDKAGEFKRVAELKTNSTTVDAAPAASPAPVSRARTIPIPIQFVYRKAQFTQQGRDSVKLLLEYLLVSKRERIMLSGHADERGSAELNMKLSRDRLNAVQERLRAGGYTGQIELLAKGESEPFTGVDRTALSAQELYQLDRRVELRLDGQ
ncbi:MAG: OmpA family protein [Alphaproteobacteria bacterium]|nr:OmpA family protein [Alphaproteobacteria bacterium]